MGLVLLTAVALLAQHLSAFAQTAPKPTPLFWSYQFIDSVGVIIHLHNSQSFYRAQFASMKQKLLDARIKHVREGALDLNGAFYAGDSAALLQDLGRAGIKVTYIFKANVTKEFVQGFPARVDPSFGSYELPNELNLQRTTPWIQTLQTWAPTFKQLIRSNPATAAYPIIGPSLADMGDDPNGQLGSLEPYIDFGNLHQYYPGYNPGNQGYGRRALPPCDAFRYGSLGYSMCHIAKVAGSKPIICTEGGYGSNPAIGHQVTPAIQAKYNSRMLMLDLKAGIPRTFLYQFVDYGTDGFGDYGQLTNTGVEKPAYTQLRGLMNELYDAPSTGTPTALPISLSGTTTDVESLMFAKSDGSYRLVLWIEKPGYDPNANSGAGAVVTVPTQAVTVGFPEINPVRRIVRFEETGALNVKDISASPPLQLTVSDNLTIVDFARTGYGTAKPRAPVINKPL
jgi:hypothetical protein